LEKVKTASGKVLEEHPLLPTEEQCSLMDDLVAGMNLDTLAPEQGEDEDEGMQEE
jgi:ATP-dependent DNA helicase 2 subunit 2